MAKNKFPNVEPRAKSIRIKFKFKGKWCRETLLLEPTQKNQALAFNRLSAINQSIATGTFIYQSEFPDSINIEKLGLDPAEHQARLFGEVAHDYMASIQYLAKSTIQTYRKALNGIWLPIWGGREIDKIPYSEIARTIESMDWGSAKTRNNALIPLRGVFQVAYVDELLNANPCDRIGNQRHQKKPPDPFSLEEVELILEGLSKYHPQVKNYFEFAFFSGLRIEELIALEWGDIDFNKAQARVQRARVAGEVKETKTYHGRDVDLTARAMQALHRQKQYTFLAGEHIFSNPVTSNPWNDNGKAQRVRYWNPVLKKLGIRCRPPKNTRHTFATMLLMSGAMPAYAAGQMGHSPVVFLTVYSKWINSEGQQGERSKLDSFISPNKPENLAKKSLRSPRN